MQAQSPQITRSPERFFWVRRKALVAAWGLGDSVGEAALRPIQVLFDILMSWPAFLTPQYTCLNGPRFFKSGGGQIGFADAYIEQARIETK